MSDIYIPGVKSKYDSDKLIDSLMKVERVPKERAEKEVKALETQKSVWQDVGRRVSSLRESARTLFSFQNPFNERIALSSDENVITGTATREASEQERTFIVKKAASPDRFLSKPLSDDYKIPAGEYVFSVGKTEVTVPFRGGSIKEFSDSVARRGKDKISVSAIVVEQKTKTLVFESLITGAENRLVFKKDAEKLALETGVVERVDDRERRFALETNTVKIPDASRVQVVEGAVKAAPLGEARVNVSPPARVRGELSIEYEAASHVLSGEKTEESTEPPGPTIPSTGSITYGGIVVESDPSSVPLPRWEKPVPPPRVDDPNVIRLSFSDGSSAFLPPMDDDRNFERKQYRLADYSKGSGNDLISIDLINKNTHREISLRSIRIFDPEASGGYKPKNPVSTAADTILSMDGIEVKRSKNDVDDLIPGVKLNIHSASETPVKVKVEPDRKTVKEAIIGVVGNYNRLAAEINILIRTDDKIVRELTYLNEDEKKSMTAKLGAMQGDVTLNQLRTTLQRAASSSYPTSAEREMALLTQIGVSTDSRKPGGGAGLDVSRLRGYLEIDEKALEQAIRDKLPAVKELFGNDTDGDLIVDSGFAYKVDAVTRPFVEMGGLVQLKTGTIDTKIGQAKRRVETLDRQLAVKEQELKRKYGAMEGALNKMERTSTSIDQFSNRGGN
ncbi:MAG: flagellar filament capping protein FliD [Treponemataceae bacterium]